MKILNISIDRQVNIYKPNLVSRCIPISITGRQRKSSIKTFRCLRTVHAKLEDKFIVNI